MGKQKEPNSGRGLIPRQSDEMPADSLSPEVLKDIVDFLSKESLVRQQELELHKEEIGIRKEQLHLSHEYAMEALRLQAQDLQEERTHRSRFFNQRNGFGLLFLLVFICFTTYLLQTDHEDVAKEILKAVGFFAAGGCSGYGYASQKKKERSGAARPNEGEEGDD